MMLMGAIALVLVGVVLWTPLRRAFFILAAVIVVAFLVSRYPSSNPSLRSYQLVFGLISHVAVETFHQSLTQVIHNTHHLWLRYHL